MRHLLRISAACVFVAFACLAELAAPAGAQSFTTSRPGGRAGHWEFYLPLICGVRDDRGRGRVQC